MCLKGKNLWSSRATLLAEMSLALVNSESANPFSDSTTSAKSLRCLNPGSVMIQYH